MELPSFSNTPTIDIPVGGRLKLFAHKWGEITSDPYILQAVQGYKLEFDPDKYPPRRENTLHKFKRNAEETAKIQDEINSLAAKNVIETCDHEEGEFISNIFTRPKKSGGIRVILDLSELNKCISYQHFKMDNIKTALALISPGCYLASVDLRDAYYTVPIHSESRKYLRFTWQGRLWQFRVLPNGLSSGPRLFTKLLKPVFANLREQGHIVIAYLDDTLIIAKTMAETKAAITAATTVLSELGFLVHQEKSVLAPTQDITFLGFNLNTVEMKVTLPTEKQHDIIQSCSELLQKENPTIRNVAKIIGQLVASFPAVQYGPLFYRDLEKDKINALAMNKGHFDRQMTLSSKSVGELQWWIANLKSQFSPIQRGNPEMEIHTDASGKGWGATHHGTTTGGRWDGHEMNEAKQNKINLLETIAISHGIKAFCSDKRDIHVLVRADNTTAIAYLNNMGGTKSWECNKVALEIWKWCISKNIWVTAAHLPGRLNIEADRMSRKFSDNTEWMLNQTAFQRIIERFGMPQIDIFASRLNKQVDRYISWRPEPEAFAVDAFTVNWSHWKFYAFPPFNLIPMCLQKIRRDNANGILVVPNWPTQAWFPILKSMLLEEPMIIRKSKTLLCQPVSGDTHPLNAHLSLLCCRIGGDFTQSRASHKGQ